MAKDNQLQRLKIRAHHTKVLLELADSQIEYAKRTGDDFGVPDESAYNRLTAHHVHDVDLIRDYLKMHPEAGKVHH